MRGRASRYDKLESQIANKFFGGVSGIGTFMALWAELAPPAKELGALAPATSDIHNRVDAQFRQFMSRNEILAAREELQDWLAH